MRDNRQNFFARSQRLLRVEIQPGVIDGQGALPRKFLGKLPVIPREDVSLRRCHRHHTERLPAADERNDHD